MSAPDAGGGPGLSGGPGWAVLRRNGVMVVVDGRGPWLPTLAHWGADHDGLDDGVMSALPWAYRAGDKPGSDAVAPFTVSPTRAQGWPGWPGLSGHRHGLAGQPLFRLEEFRHEEFRHEQAGHEEAGHEEAGAPGGGDFVYYRGADPAAALVLEGELVLTPDGVLKHRQVLTSTAGADQPPYAVDDLLTLLPVPEDVVEVLDFGGRWADEAQAQRHELMQGTWLREQRRGRTGPDTPLLLCVGSRGFGYRDGNVWGVHLGWSGDQRYLAQRLNTGRVLIGAGEILAGGEVVLGPGESVRTPWAYAVYSAGGLDGATARLHAMLRRRPQHPRRSRPVILNTWEAVLFDQSYERLAELATVAAEVGVERFVVDDGWFGSRRDDTSGLGDWYVSGDVWPQGLGPLAELVRSLGMEFGLWFEPEMVNLRSDLAVAHPGWVLGTAGRMPPAQRSQQVLDLAHPDAFAWVLDRLSALVLELHIDFIKWDHNRDLADPVHRSGPRQGLPAVRDQTLATYAMMDELRRRHPWLEIESCSSGGARVDLGVLERTDRVWASDCIDPIERARIVQGFATLLPLELIGAHVASARSSSTGRQHDLSLRLAVALFGHQGIEWDITTATRRERRALAAWVSLAKSLRPVLHGGELVRMDRWRHDGTSLFGVVAQDRSEAVFAFLRSTTSPYVSSPPVRLGGLAPDGRYDLKSLPLGTDDEGGGHGRAQPWALTLPGSVLMDVGFAAPALPPDRAVLYYLVRTG